MRGRDGFQRAEALGDTITDVYIYIYAHRVHAIVVRIHSDNRNSDRGCVARDDGGGEGLCKRANMQTQTWRERTVSRRCNDFRVAWMWRERGRV